MILFLKNLTDLLYEKVEVEDYNLTPEQNQRLEDMVTTAESKVYDAVKQYTRDRIEDLTYRAKQLPTYIKTGMQRVKNFLVPYIIPIKEYGRYHIGRKIIDIDPVDVVKKGYNRAHSTLETIAHEIIHAYQEKLGHMRYYSREIIEGIASYLNSKIWGNYGNEPYKAESNIIRRLVGKYGEREIMKPSNPERIMDKFYGMYQPSSPILEPV